MHVPPGARDEHSRSLWGKDARPDRAELGAAGGRQTPGAQAARGDTQGRMVVMTSCAVC